MCAHWTKWMQPQQLEQYFIFILFLMVPVSDINPIPHSLRLSKIGGNQLLFQTTLDCSKMLLIYIIYIVFKSLVGGLKLDIALKIWILELALLTNSLVFSSHFKLSLIFVPNNLIFLITSKCSLSIEILVVNQTKLS